MRIAFFVELSGSRIEGGRNIATYYLMEELKKKGHQVAIFSFQDSDSHLMPRFFRETPLIRDATAIPIWGRKILRQLDGTYDAFILTSSTTASLYRPRTPTVFYCHGVLAQKFSKFEPITASREKMILHLSRPLYCFLRYMERRSMLNTSMVLAVHQVTMDYILHGIGLRGTPCRVIPNGVDLAAFHPANEAGSKILFVGRASPTKGFDTVLEATPHIKGEIMAVVNKYFSNLRKEAVKLGVEFMANEPHEKMPEIYHQASLLVLPSNDEELSLTVLEAMASGLPVVVTPAAAAGLVENGVNGYVVPPRDHKRLAEAVNTILADNALRKRMGEANRRIAERFNWGATADQVEETLEEIIDNRQE
jgi:glycosyltransferase involved in cell wall biosynthesis